MTEGKGLGAEGDAVGGEVLGEEFGEQVGRGGALQAGVGFEVFADLFGHGAGVETEEDFAFVGGLGWGCWGCFHGLTGGMGG